jgi:hypothetical protein
MSKKSFRGVGGLSSVIRVSEEAAKPQESTILPAPTSNPKRGRPRTNFREVEKSSQEGCVAEETRATFIVNEQDLEKIKAVAYWERQPIKEIISEAIKGYLEKYEQSSGEVKPIPRSK